MFLEGGREPEEPEGEPLWGDSANTYIQGRAAVNHENTEKVPSLEKKNACKFCNSHSCDVIHGAPLQFGRGEFIRTRY